MTNPPPIDQDASRWEACEDEIALRAAINVLRDTIESRRMPSGQPLARDAAELHERAVDRLETLLRMAVAGCRP